MAFRDNLMCRLMEIRMEPEMQLLGLQGVGEPSCSYHSGERDHLRTRSRT